MEQLGTVFQSLWQIVLNVGELAVQLLLLAMHWSLLIAWVAWWLLGVNWTRVWPALARGAWVPLALLIVVSALVWSRIAPSDFTLGFITLPNFWWQLGAVGMLSALAFFCGWLQGLCHWAPPEINLDPPAHAPAAHGHHH